MPAKFPPLVLILMLVLSFLIEYEDLVEYIHSTDIGINVVNGRMYQLVLSYETLFSCWVRHYWVGGAL